MFHIKNRQEKNKKDRNHFLLINLANRSYPLMLSLWSLTIKRYQFKALIAC